MVNAEVTQNVVQGPLLTESRISMTGAPDSSSLQLQPSDGRVIDSLGQTAAESSWRSAVVCVAYATHAGVAQLVGELRKSWSAFDSARKLFVVGLDFGLTEPGALRYLASLPNTACHVHEAARTLAARLRPWPLFHPRCMHLDWAIYCQL